MQIPVIKNPVAKSNGARRKTMAKRKHRASPAQIAARKKFAAKYGGKKRKAAPRPAAKRRKRKASGRTRPVVIRKAGKLYRPRRSSIAAHAKFANPFLGGLAMLGNPKRRKARKARRSHHRSSRRRSMSIFKNPVSSTLGALTAAPKEMISKDFLIEASSVAAGFVLPDMIMVNLPVSLRDAQWKGYATKVAVIAALAAGTGLISKRASKAVLLGGGVSLLLDLYHNVVVPMLHGSVSAPTAVNQFFGNPGDPGMSQFWGNPGDPGAGIGDGAEIGEAFA